MDLLEQILQRHQMDGTTYSNRSRIGKYRPVHSDVIVSQKDHAQQWIQSQAKKTPLKSTGHFRNNLSTSTQSGWVAQPPRQKFTIHTRKNIRNMGDFLSGHGSEWSTAQPRKEFSITVYAGKTKVIGGISATKTSKEQMKERGKEPLQL